MQFLIWLPTFYKTYCIIMWFISFFLEGRGVTIHPTNSNEKIKIMSLSHVSKASPWIVLLSRPISSQGLLIKGTGSQHQTFIWVSLEQVSTSRPPPVSCRSVKSPLKPAFTPLLSPSTKTFKGPLSNHYFDHRNAELYCNRNCITYPNSLCLYAIFLHLLILILSNKIIHTLFIISVYLFGPY